jgi:hypothetical protein
MSMQDLSARGTDLVAAGSEQVRAYLSAQGMVDEDIALHLDEAASRGTAVFTFGSAEVAFRYTISTAGGSCLLTVDKPAW